jgi:hypothetical protein
MNKKKKNNRAAAPRARPRPPDFDHHVDHAAMVDRADLSVDGSLNNTFVDHELSHVIRKAIFRPGRFYGACVYAKWPFTGNPVMIRHGKMTKFKNVPQMHITLRSERTPLTAAQVESLTKKCASQKQMPHVTVSSVELAFDFTGSTVDEVGEQLIHRAQRVHSLQDRKGRKTIYVGSRKSSWQVRIYDKDKAKGVVRFEFIFRRSFLSRFGLNTPADLLSLRRLNIWRLVSLRKFSRTRARRVASRFKKVSLRQLVVDWVLDRRSKASLVILLRQKGIKPAAVFRRTRLQKRLEAMQHQLIW